MPWLAPIGTPEASGPVESQVPIWQSIRASRSFGIGLHPRQRLRQHRQTLQRLGVAVRVRLARADAFDAMVDGADPGREPQPFRGVPAEPGIEDHRARHQQRMAQRFLDPGLLVGDARRGRELAAGNRGRHADLAHRRRCELWRSAAPGPDPVDVVGMADIVGEAELHRLGAIGDRTAADRDDQIGIRGAGLFAGGDDGRARRVRRHRVEGAGAARPQQRGGWFRSHRFHGSACR